MAACVVIEGAVQQFFGQQKIGGQETAAPYRFKNGLAQARSAPLMVGLGSPLPAQLSLEIFLED